MDQDRSDIAIVRQRLRHLCQDESDIDLAEAGLLLAALSHPGIDLQPYRDHLATLAAEVGKFAGGEPNQALSHVLATTYGYAGDSAHYDDLQNADMVRVIDRRKGLPVAIGILYLQVARAQGWAACGLSFPNHFLIRVENGHRRAIIDPFHGGQVLTADKLRALRKTVAGDDAELAPDHFDTVADVEILLRLQNNIKSRLLQKRDGEGALSVLDSMLLVTPNRAELWYETGMINAALEKHGAAIRALERCLTTDGAVHMATGARERARETLQRLKQRLN